MKSFSFLRRARAPTSTKPRSKTWRSNSNEPSDEKSSKRLWANRDPQSRTSAPSWGRNPNWETDEEEIRDWRETFRPEVIRSRKERVRVDPRVNLDPRVTQERRVEEGPRVGGHPVELEDWWWTKRLKCLRSKKTFTFTTQEQSEFLWQLERFCFKLSIRDFRWEPISGWPNGKYIYFSLFLSLFLF